MKYSRGFWKICIVLLILAYIPIIGLPLFNSEKPYLAGLPLVWFYSVVWVILVFILLLLVYFIDRRIGGIFE
ncbi:MAG TPA: hypothetical protein EYH40_05780 [Desulfurococcales archaeon]|nr:hypothetical protein [Desulfurococcales archaeon]